MSNPSQRQDGPGIKEGIYRFTRRSSETVRRFVERTGCTAFQVDLEQSSQLGAVLKRIGTQLQFPEWYGNNLDALHDCLTDSSWREGKSYILVLMNADALSADHHGFAELNGVFAAAVDFWKGEGITFVVAYELDSATRTEGLPALPGVN